MPIDRSITRLNLIRMAAPSAVAAAALITGSAPAFARDDSDLEERRRRLLSDAQARRRKVLPGWNTPNGWPAENIADSGGTIWTRDVPGTDVSLTIRDGEPRALLEYVIQRFSLEIRALGRNDVLGFDSQARGSGPFGNHASGTAIYVLPDFYPRGANNGMFDHEVRAVRDILASCAGLVGWGGDAEPRSQGFFGLTAGPESRELGAWAKQQSSAGERLGGSGGLKSLGA